MQKIANIFKQLTNSKDTEYFQDKWHPNPERHYFQFINELPDPLSDGPILSSPCSHATLSSDTQIDQKDHISQK